MNLSEAIEMMKERNRQLVLKHRGHTPYTQQTDEVITAMMAAASEIDRLREAEDELMHLKAFLSATGINHDDIMHMCDFPLLLYDVLIRDYSNYEYATHIDKDTLIWLGLAVKSYLRALELDYIINTHMLPSEVDMIELEKKAINIVYKKWKIRTIRGVLAIDWDPLLELSSQLLSILTPKRPR